ncbi:hypothetical protein PoB_007709900 [Plakobranchus ocellatus]|uniref:Uncharacterized protein n=1 Tax=Plakobranchus ocellatus TaxID=259542 RepID=A0AAV4E312_9GAST|nr:hypothetical protein PoB_007709900 [Plakobranchus ocellatus]
MPWPKRNTQSRRETVTSLHRVCTALSRLAMKRGFATADSLNEFSIRLATPGRPLVLDTAGIIRASTNLNNAGNTIYTACNTRISSISSLISIMLATPWPPLVLNTAANTRAALVILLHVTPGHPLDTAGCTRACTNFHTDGNTRTITNIQNAGNSIASTSSLY